MWDAIKVHPSRSCGAETYLLPTFFILFRDLLLTAKIIIIFYYSHYKIFPEKYFDIFVNKKYSMHKFTKVGKKSMKSRKKEFAQEIGFEILHDMSVQRYAPTQQMILFLLLYRAMYTVNFLNCSR